MKLALLQVSTPLRGDLAGISFSAVQFAKFISKVLEDTPLEGSPIRIGRPPGDPGSSLVGLRLRRPALRNDGLRRGPGGKTFVGPGGGFMGSVSVKFAPWGADGKIEKVMELYILDENIDGKAITKCKPDPTRAPRLIWDVIYRPCSSLILPDDHRKIFSWKLPRGASQRPCKAPRGGLLRVQVEPPAVPTCPASRAGRLRRPSFLRRGARPFKGCL